MMEYVKYIKSKAYTTLAPKSERPILSEEDEKFLDRITSQANPVVLPPIDHGGDAQIALMNGAQNVALPPTTPSELTEEPENVKGLAAADTAPKKKSWNWLRRDSRDSKRQTTAAGLHDIAEGLKPDSQVEDEQDAEAKKEEEDMTRVLEDLNLAAIDNRVFSISEDTQELLQKFNQVLKDLINGVPTAYRDLESLLTNGDQQLQKIYNSLPSFLQKLVEKLPETMTKGIAPEMMAAAAQRASSYGINLQKSGQAAGKAAKFMKTPSLKDLVTKPGAITGMLRSIMQFLQTRFPAFAGVNVLWSMALFLLLIVFWYCHKRGKEVRLDKERELTEQEIKNLEEEWRKAHPNESVANAPRPTPGTTTTAPVGATMEQVTVGILEADVQKIAAASQAREPTVQNVVP